MSETPLWPGDTGVLREASRRALVQLLRGPHLGAQRHGRLWTALLNDEAMIRSRLADVFLELVVDRESEVAFVRNVRASDLDPPQVVRTAPLTFLDTAVLLYVRQLLMRASPGERVIVGSDELADQVEVYRGKDRADPALFGKRVNATIVKLERYGILARTTTEGRFEVSPVLRLVLGAEEVAAIHAEFRRIAVEDAARIGGGRRGAAPEPRPDLEDDDAGDGALEAEGEGEESS